MYDLIVIGAGVAGYTSAIRAAKEGMKVAIVEKKKVGGTCLNRGCIPTKYLIHTASTYKEMQKFADKGIVEGEVKINYEKLVADMQVKVHRLSSGIQSLIRANAIDYFEGSARFVDKNSVIINETEFLAGKNILIATGSKPRILAGLDTSLQGVYTTDEVFDSLHTVPKSMVIIGSGIVGLEMAFLYSSLGTKVRVVECRAKLFENMDEDVENLLLKSLYRYNVELYFESKVLEIFDEDGLQVAISNEGKTKIIDTDTVLLAAGREPSIQGLGVEELGIEILGGRIVTNPNCQTNIETIYAIGDVNGKSMTAYAAAAQAVNVIDNIMGKSAKKAEMVPTCIFSKPEIASVGLTEKAAIEQGYEIVVGKFLMSANGRSVVEEQEGFIKIIADKKSDRILGGICACYLATELVSQITIAMNADMTMEQFRKTVFPHPTYSEGIGEAAEMTIGKSVYML